MAFFSHLSCKWRHMDRACYSELNMIMLVQFWWVRTFATPSFIIWKKMTCILMYFITMWTTLLMFLQTNNLWKTMWSTCNNCICKDHQGYDANNNSRNGSGWDIGSWVTVFIRRRPQTRLDPRPPRRARRCIPQRRCSLRKQRSDHTCALDYSSSLLRLSCFLEAQQLVPVVLVLLAPGSDLCGKARRDVIHEGIELVEDPGDAALFF